MMYYRIRAQLLALVIAATVPFLALIGIGLWNQWRTEAAATGHRALNEARLIAAQVDDQIGNFDNLLIGLSHAISTKPVDAKRTRELLRQVKSQLPDFVNNLLLLSPDGQSIATSFEDEHSSVYAGDFSYFRKIKSGERLAIGEAERGRVTGRWFVAVARSIENEAGQLEAVLVVGIWLEHLQDALRLDRLPPETVIRILDENGIVIAQNVNGPNWIGRNLSKVETVARHIAAKEASEVTHWSDGIERFTGSTTAHRVPWLVSIGFPSNTAFASIATPLSWGGLFSAIAIAAAFMIAWLISGRIVRPLQQLGKDTFALAAGELTHRSAIRTKDELGDLAANFNVMAAALEQRHEEAKRSADELRQAKDALAALIENVPVPIVAKDLTTLKLVLVNHAYETFIGMSRHEIVGKTVHDLYPTEDAAKIAEYDNRALQHKESVSKEFPVQTPKGTRIVRTTRLVVGCTNDGTPRHLLVVIEDVTDRRKAEETIWQMAHHDALTGLPNRVLYYKRLEDELKHVKRGEQFAVLCLDLDRFKTINDTLGHSIGDELLRAVAERLRGCVRETDMVARLGGDEFAIVQAGVCDPKDASVLASRIHEAMKAPFDLGGVCATTSVSVGISLAPINATSSNDLMKQADMALYQAKSAGRNTCSFFEPEMDAKMRARRVMESDLRNALVDGQFELHYQPIVDLRSNRIVSVEALLRWRHPEQGVLPPAEFVPLAEETGLIIPLGDWVLRQACSDAAKFPDDVKVAINLSPAQIKERNLSEVLITSLAASGLPPNRLELEITEHVLIRDDDATLSFLRRLRSLGVKIVMDDFGTGYSSLNYLRRLPLDKIKIDRSFVGDLSDGTDASLAIVQAVVRLADALRVQTTAEGIETAEQLELVRVLGCTQMQGYLFSAPIRIEHLLRLFPRAINEAATAA